MNHITARTLSPLHSSPLVSAFSASRKEVEYTHELMIDSSARPGIRLMGKIDGLGQTFYTGKIQLPCELNCRLGVSFMIFVAEEDCEEMQIGMMPKRKKEEINPPTLQSNGNIIIGLRKVLDRNSAAYYIGEALGDCTIPLYSGIFCHIFIAREGEEKMVLSPLRHIAKNYDQVYERPVIERR